MLHIIFFAYFLSTHQVPQHKSTVLFPLSAGHFERPPYNESDIRSVYHVREYDVHKLMQIEEPIDIFISHDWPLGITDFGNWQKLIKKKTYFGKEVNM